MKINKIVLRWIAWIFGLSIVGVTLLLIVLYGHSFGHIKSILWLTAFASSFVTSILIVEPIKQLALSAYTTMFTKSPTPIEINQNNPRKCNKWVDYSILFKKYTRSVVIHDIPPDDAKNAIVERYLIYYRELTADLLVFCLYLVTLLLVILGSRDHMAYHSNRMATMYADHSKSVQGPLEPVMNNIDFQRFLENVLVPTLHPNETEYIHSGWLTGKHVKLLGVARLRQHRVQQFCDIHKTSIDMLAKMDCGKWFEHSNRDKTRYNSGWTPYVEVPYRDRFPRLTKPWVYHSTWETLSIPLFGQKDLYSGGGYTIELGRNFRNSLTVLRYIRRSGWIDRRTTVVFVEFALYSVDSNLFNVITIIAERTPYGNYEISSNVHTVKLLISLESLSGVELFLFACYILFTSVFVIRLIKQVFNRKLLEFLRNIWNIMDTFIVVFSVGMLVMFFKRDKYVQSILEALEKSRNNMFVSFYIAAFFDRILTWWSSILVLMATMRIWKIFHFIHVFKVISYTFSRAASTLFSLTLATALILVILAFGVFLINGAQSKTFGSMAKTITSLAVLSFGFANEHISSRELGDKWMGIILTSLLTVILNIYLLGMFITVVCYYFTVVRQTWAMEMAPFSYFQFLRDEYGSARWTTCVQKVESVELTYVSELEKSTARMELIDYQLSLVSEAIVELTRAGKMSKSAKNSETEI